MHKPSMERQLAALENNLRVMLRKTLAVLSLHASAKVYVHSRTLMSCHGVLSHCVPAVGQDF